MQVTPRSCEVVELLDQPAKVADAVAVAVEERPDVQLVDDRVLVPELVVVNLPVVQASAGVVDGHARLTPQLWSLHDGRATDARSSFPYAASFRILAETEPP